MIHYLGSVPVDPNEFGQAVEAISPTVASIAAETSTGTFQSFLDSTLRAINQVVLTQAQREMLKVQVERAKRGLDPLPVASYTTTGNAASLAPAPAYSAGNDFMGKVLIGVAVAGAVAFLMQGRRGGRR